MGGKRKRGLKVRVWWDCCISRGGGPDGAVEVYNLEESEEEVAVLVDVKSSEEAATQLRGQLQK